MKHVCLSDVARPRRSKAHPADHPTLPFVGLEHIEAHTRKLLGTVPAATMRSAGNRFHPRDVLYSRLRPYLNKVWRADRQGICSGEFIVLPESDQVDADFLCYRLNASDFVRFTSSLNAGDRPRVDWDQISSFTFLLPSSLETQRSVVSHLDLQFSRLDAAVAALKRAQANLKRYRASVLKAACEGRLVPPEAELSRIQNPKSKIENGDALLSRILEERRKSWTGKGKYKEPAAPDTTNLPPLPEGWAYTSAETICDVVDPHPSHRTPPSCSDGIPYVGIGDVDSRGRFNLQDSRKVAQSVLDEHRQRYQLAAGDFIIGKIGTVGKCVQLHAPFQYALSANVVLVQPNRRAIVPVFLRLLIESPAFQRDFEERSRATTQAAFGIHRFRSLVVPLPPLAEQERIVAEVERRLSVADALEATLAANLSRATRLRRAVLSQAFSVGSVSNEAQHA